MLLSTVVVFGRKKKTLFLVSRRPARDPTDWESLQDSSSFMITVLINHEGTMISIQNKLNFKALSNLSTEKGYAVLMGVFQSRPKLSSFGLFPHDDSQTRMRSIAIAQD